MNIYLLVEGRCTEAILYPAWLSSCLPGHECVDDFTSITGNSIFCFSGGGYPGVIDNGIRASVADVNSVRLYDFLIVVADADDRDPLQMVNDIERRAAEAGLANGTKLLPIIQKRCIETWLLGNSSFVARNPNLPELVDCKRFFDVNRRCPEKMTAPPTYGGSNSRYHHYYLKQAFRERRLTYSKRSPGVTSSRQYLNALRRRFEAGDLPSMAALFGLIPEES